MLPDVTHSAVPKELTQVRHIIPPVAPITLNTTGFTKVNQDFDKKHLSAFVDGASDHLCVAAARRVFKGEFCRPLFAQVKNGTVPLLAALGLVCGDRPSWFCICTANYFDD